jgi:crotonobetaine/carnitine-CoA ligase
MYKMYPSLESSVNTHNRGHDMDRSAIDELQMHGQDIPWLLGHWAGKKPDHPALVWEPGDGERRSWTYAELLASTHDLAAGLRDRGIEVGDKVLIHADNCPEMLIAWLACATLGAVAVTTNTRSAPAEVGWFIDKSQCVAAITEAKFVEHVATADRDLRWVAVIGAPPAGSDHVAFTDLAGDGATWEGRPIEPLRPFGIMFTSGTTSKPKAVVHTHANAVWASRIGPRNIDLGTDDRYLIYLPLFHVNAQSWSMFSVLGVGATAVLMPKWSTSRFWDVVVRHEITHISLMPFVIPSLMEADKPANSLRVAVFGLILPMLDQMCGVDVYAAYGMTETVIHATNGRPADQLPERSMGRITPGYEFAVVDRDTGALCPEGTTGELWLKGTRGIQLFLEYFDNPEANAKAFEDGWFKTGDMVMLGEGGNLFYRERDKDLLKVGGENVSAREVEDVITTVAGVGQVAVVGKKHDFLDEVVVAFVITGPAAPDDDALEKQVIETCRSQLADFKVPRAVYVVDDFPRGTLDKILKNKLREMADERPAVEGR